MKKRYKVKKMKHLLIYLLPVSRLEHDKEEAKEGTEIKIITPNKLLTRLSVILTQIKAENNSYKLKNENRKIVNLPLTQ